MFKKVFILLFFAVAASLTLQAQTIQNQKTQSPNLKPNIVVGDLVFAIQTLNNINIQGAEVDAFLAVKDQFKPALKKIQEQNMKMDQEIEVEVPLQIANNFLQFLQRATFSGSQAERYKRLQESFIAAAEKIKQQ